MKNMKKVLIALSVMAMVFVTACGAGAGDKTEEKGPETTTEAKKKVDVKEAGDRFIKGKHYNEDITETELAEYDLKLVGKAYFDIDGDGTEELIVKLGEFGEDPAFDYISYQAYQYKGGKFQLAFRIPYYPNGEDGLLYYDAKDKAVAVHTRESDCHWTYYWDINSDVDALKSVGYQDDKATSEYVRHFYDCPGMFNYEAADDIFAYYEKYEFASYKWEDSDDVKDAAMAALAEHQGELTDIEFEEISTK